MSDARFEDGADKPMRVLAQDPRDVAVFSAILQDAVGTVADVSYLSRKRQVAMLLNRFRWEDQEAARTAGRPLERVRCLLLIEGVSAFRAQGFGPQDHGLVFSILSLEFAGADDGSGRLEVILAGDGMFAVDVECLELRLQDVARPHIAGAGAPDHQTNEDS